MVRVAINGFGRIGRCTFKQFLEDDRFEVVGINDLSELDDLAYLLKYDSVHGWYPRKVSTDGATLVVDGHKIPFSQERDPSKLPWGDLGVDVVVAATGAMRSREATVRYLESGTKKFVISTPSDDADSTFVIGVNEDTIDPEKHHIVSNASCTTNCLAPVAKVLSDRFGVEHLMLSTIHAYTSSQSLMDLPTRKRRRGRAAALSIIPTTTGATKATEKVIPELKGKMTGMAYRVPVEDGSVSDITATLSREVTIEEVHEALAEAAEGRMKGVLRLTEEELVSRDIIGDPHSSIVDTPSTLLLNGNVIKLVAWYVNEWGYSARMVDISAIVARES